MNVVASAAGRASDGNCGLRLLNAGVRTPSEKAPETTIRTVFAPRFPNLRSDAEQRLFRRG
jgi:hypothetical protein